MKYLLESFIAVILMFNVAFPSQVERKELENEVRKLEALRKEILALTKRNQELHIRIESERKALEEVRKEFEEFLKRSRAERYQRLAKVFEKMEPEMAGERFSKMDEEDAAYILFNMKERAAGNVLNYVDPEKVNRIVKILTQIGNNTSE